MNQQSHISIINLNCIKQHKHVVIIMRLFVSVPLFLYLPTPFRRYMHKKLNKQNKKVIENDRMSHFQRAYIKNTVIVNEFQITVTRSHTFNGYVHA